MSRRTGQGRALAAAAGLTTWLALLSWSVFVVDPWTYLDVALAGIAVIAGVGIATRRLRLPVAVVVAAQLLGVMLFVNLMWGSTWWPSPASVEQTALALRTAVETSQQYMAPVGSAAPSVAPLMVSGALLLHVLVDALAVTLGRVPVSGLPLLVVYSLPVSIVQEPVSWVVFVLAAAGFLLMLVVQESDRVRHWGRSVDGRTTDRGTGVAGMRHTLLVGSAATALAVAVPVVVPTLDLAVFAGAGPGSRGDGNVELTNPMADLQRDLLRGPDEPLLRVTADQRPTYLRTAALTSYNGNAWSPGNREWEGNEATGDFPPPTGLAPDVPRDHVRWELSSTDKFDSEWLPTSLFVDRLDAGEDWAYDEEVLDVHGDEQDVRADDMSWTLTAMQPRFEFEALTSAPPAPFELDEKYTALPDDLDPLVRQLAEEVTVGLPSRYERAVALQSWFRREFSYSTDVVPGASGDLLVEFLREGGRVGYCEQFAAAMAIMARALDIPSRVAVGFLSPDAVPGQPGEWVFSAWDLHAWPELYFEGAGWVRFEPTPAARAEEVPPYTQGDGAGPAPDPTAGPTTTLPEPQPGPTDTRTLDPGAAPGSDTGAGGGLTWLWWTGLAVALVLALLLVPGAVRRARTAARWHGDDPAEAAWAELRDLAADCGVRWPPGRSPRVTAAVLVKSFAAPAGRHTLPRPATGRLENVEAATALDRIVAAVEQSRYAGDPVLPDTAELREWVELCAEALRGGLTRQARFRAAWLPASVVSWRHVVLPRPTLTRVRSHQDVVDHVG